MKINQIIPLDSHSRAPDSAQESSDHRLREAARLYEQHFLGEMVKAMRQAVPESDLMKTSFAEKLYRDQLDQQYTNNWSKQGGVGLADLIYNNIKERMAPLVPTARPQGPLPIPANGKTPVIKVEELKSLSHIPGEKNIKKQSLNLQLQLTEEPNSFLGQSLSITSPWSGKVLDRFQTEDGLSAIQISHPEGFISKIIFPGALEKITPNQEVQAGQKLGQFSSPDQTKLNWSIEAIV